MRPGFDMAADMTDNPPRPAGEGGDARIARALIILVVATIFAGFANFDLRAWLATYLAQVLT